MKQDIQLKLQAYLDAELPPTERAEVEALLRIDAPARLLLLELTQTNAALRGYEAELHLPETREFFWSKIERQIGPVTAPAVVSQSISLAQWWRRIAIPIGAAVVIAIAGLFGLPWPSTGADFFAASGDAVAFTYQNYETGTTLVWLDFSVEDANLSFE